MATAEELLAGVTTVDKTLIISNDLRTISIPPTVANLGVESDNDVLRLKFKMPRYIGDIDLSTFSIRINYVNAQGESDVYTVSDATTTADHISFSWLVGPTATRYKGETRFNVCLVKLTSDGEYVDREFNTTVATMKVLEGLEVDESLVEEYSDLIEQWRRELFGIGDTEEAKIKATSEAEQEAIANKGAEVLATIPADYATAVSMTDNADRTKADAIICSTQGEVITVSDSSDDYLRGLKIFGKTTQITTTGKNKLNVPKSLTFTGYTSIAVSIPAGTYKLTWASETHGGANPPHVQFSGNSVGVLLRSSDNGRTVTLAKDETMVYIYANNYDINGSNGITATINQLMLSVDGGDYEPYDGGVASPSPDYPQELVSIESPAIHIHSKNLANNYVDDTVTYSGITIERKSGSSEVILDGTASKQFSYKILDERTLPAGVYTISVYGLNRHNSSNDRLYVYDTVNSAGIINYIQTGSPKTFELKTATTFRVDVIFAADSSYADQVIQVQIESGSSATVYESAKTVQILTTPKGLPGIPVSSGGNYTDSNGQQWICNEIDFERGVYVQRVAVRTFDGTEPWGTNGDRAHYVYSWNGVNGGWTLGHAVSTHYINDHNNAYMGVEGYFAIDANGRVYLTSQAATVEEFKTWLTSNNVTIACVLATPIETPLDTNELQAFRSAHTNFPNTTVLNDAGATMELKYNADTQTYLDNCFRPTDEQVQESVDNWLDENEVTPTDEQVDTAVSKYFDNPSPSYELIETITLTEDVKQIERTTEPDGTPYCFEAVMLECDMVAGEKASYLTHEVRMANNKTCDYYMDKGINTTVEKIVIHTYSLYGKVMGMYSRPVPNTWDVPSGWYPPIYLNLTKEFAPINRVRVGGGVSLPAGSVIKIYAIRASKYNALARIDEIVDAVISALPNGDEVSY